MGKDKRRDSTDSASSTESRQGLRVVRHGQITPKTAEDIIAKALKDPEIKALLDEAYNETNPEIAAEKFWKNPQFQSRLGHAIFRVAVLGFGYAAAGIFYTAAAQKFVDLLVSGGYLAEWLAPYFVTTFQAGSVGVNGPFISAGTMTTFKFVKEHTVNDGKKIASGKLPVTYIIPIALGMIVCGATAYLGTYGPYNLAAETIPDAGMRLFCNIANTLGNAAGGAGIAKVVVFGPAARWFKSKPKAALKDDETSKSDAVDDGEDVEKGLLTSSSSSYGATESVQHSGSATRNPNSKVIRELLLHDLKWLSGALRNIKQEDATALFKNPSFKTLIAKLSTETGNSNEAYLKLVLKCAVLLTEKQQPRSTFDTAKNAGMISLACVPSQLGLIADGIRYVDSLPVTGFIKGAAQGGSVIAPIAMVSVFGWNFTKQSQSLNAIDLSGSKTFNSFYYGTLIPFFILCSCSFAATGGTGLEQLGIFFLLIIALSTVGANFVPGRVEIREYYEEFSLLFANKDVSEAAGFINHIKAIPLILDALIEKVEDGTLADSECTRLFSLIAQFVIQMKTPVTAPQPGSEASSSSQVSAAPDSVGSALTKYNGWVENEMTATSGASSGSSWLTTQPTDALTPVKFLESPNERYAFNG